MKQFSIICLCILGSIVSKAQDLQQYIDKFVDIANDVAEKIPDSEECKKMINDLDDLSDEIEKVLNDDEIHPDDIKNLQKTKKNAEDWRHF